MIIKINEGSAYERVIGESDPAIRLFTKRVKESKHLFRKFDAWGIDADYFRNVLLPNNYTIKIVDTEKDKVYITMAEKFSKNGQHFHFKKDQDYQAQIFLSRRFWEVLSRKEDEINQLENWV